MPTFSRAKKLPVVAVSFMMIFVRVRLLHSLSNIRIIQRRIIISCATLTPKLSMKNYQLQDRRRAFLDRYSFYNNNNNINIQQYQRISSLSFSVTDTCGSFSTAKRTPAKSLLFGKRKSSETSAQLSTSNDTTTSASASSSIGTTLELSTENIDNVSNKIENDVAVANDVDWREDDDDEELDYVDGVESFDDYVDGVESFDDYDGSDYGTDDDTTTKEGVVEVDEGTDNNLLQREYNGWVKAVDKQLLVLDRKRVALQNELRRVQQLQQLQSRANLITSNMYLFTSNPTQRTVTVQDWSIEVDNDNDTDINMIELSLNPKYSTAIEEAAALYDEAKKMKRGSQVIQPLIESTIVAYDTLYDIQQQLSKIAAVEEVVADDYNDNRKIDIDSFRYIQEQLRRTSKTTNFNPPDFGSTQKGQKGNIAKKVQFSNNRDKKPDIGTPASNVRKIISPSGTIIYVGRNRRGNEYISLNIARNNDLWMHARGIPGAHVVIKQQKQRNNKNNNKRRSNDNNNKNNNNLQNYEQNDNNEEDDEDGTESRDDNDDDNIDECIQLGANLAAFYSDGRTERKVSISVAEPKHILKPRNAPLGAVKLREELFVCIGYPDNVPIELKVAREEAGQISTDFFRSTDKSKLRKRNKQSIQKEKAKKKKQQSKKEQEQY